MHHPIEIKTAYGAEQFDILLSQFNIHRDSNNQPAFQERCEEDYQIQSAHLGFFLDDPKLSKKHSMVTGDVEGWNLFNMMNDTCNILKYFTMRVK